MRVAAFELLGRFPRGALPGLTTAASVAQLVRWALAHLGSPRACESDAAAYVLRLVWQRYRGHNDVVLCVIIGTIASTAGSRPGC